MSNRNALLHETIVTVFVALVIFVIFIKIMFF